MRVFRLSELIDRFSNGSLGAASHGGNDVLGRVYEYFPSEFAGSEGKCGGEFDTRGPVIRNSVEMRDPSESRAYDPCSGSGGMFVRSEKVIESHGGRLRDIAIYGQERNYRTWRLRKRTLARDKIQEENP